MRVWLVRKMFVCPIDPFRTKRRTRAKHGEAAPHAAHSASFDKAAFELPYFRETDKIMEFVHSNARNWRALSGAVRADVIVSDLKR